ncbi:hypothetical protein BJ742DRAFT_830585 [Cladochytrium replicatum]|nr:hypothetical protein BJ742DRAFT_830585 [Cladochytrium replicatum]
MAVEAKDLQAGRIMYLISALIAAASLGISLYTLSSTLNDRFSKRQDTSLAGKLFRSCVLLLAACVVSVESVAITLELWLSATGELHAWSVLLRLVALSWRLNLIALACCFRFAVVITNPRYKMLWERISVGVLISNCVVLTVWRVVDFLNALKKNPSLDFDAFKEPAGSSILAGLVPFLMYIYGSAVIFLPPLLRSRPANVQSDGQKETGLKSLRVTEISFTGINLVLLTTFLAVTFIPMGPLTQKALVTLVVHVAVAFECFYVYLVRAITGARSLYDKVSGGSSKQGVSVGATSQGGTSSNGKFRDSRYPPLPAILPAQSPWDEQRLANSSASQRSGSSFGGYSSAGGNGGTRQLPMPQQFVSWPQNENYGGSYVGSQAGGSVAGSHAGLNAYKPGTNANGSQVGPFLDEPQGEYGRPTNWGAPYSSQYYAGNNRINIDAVGTPFRQ